MDVIIRTPSSAISFPPSPSKKKKPLNHPSLSKPSQRRSSDGSIWRPALQPPPRRPLLPSDRLKLIHNRWINFLAREPTKGRSNNEPRVLIISELKARPFEYGLSVVKHPQRTVLTTLWEIIGSREVVEIPLQNSCRRQPPGVVSRRLFFYLSGRCSDGNEQSNVQRPLRPIGCRFRCHRESRNEVVWQPRVPSLPQVPLSSTALIT